MGSYMDTNNVPSQSISTFESIKKINTHGIDYWSARYLQNLLGYTEWRKFEGIIQKAVISCENNGNNPLNHFVGADKMVNIGSKYIQKSY